jgi:hypothetical protein
MPAQDKRVISPRKTLRPVLLIMLILAVLLGFAIWKLALAPQEPAVSYPPPPLTQPAPPAAPDPALPSEPFLPPGDPALSAGPEPEPEDQCTLVSGQIGDFFAHLEQQDYIRAREIDAAQAYFGALGDRLLADPPVVSGETDSLFAILNNTAHFYRVLQKDDLLLLKDVLINEREELEVTLDLFYRWSLISADCPAGDVAINLPLPALYEYAGFFLNTLGGRSYLFRREARVRLLAQYYSVLVLDRANAAQLNRHGLDIRPTIASLLAEMPAVESLQWREEYLATLLVLQDRYQREYGN